ncbi:MAG: hypothetical protein ACKV2U_27590 [Bryobacteraceae bacterium]
MYRTITLDPQTPLVTAELMENYVLESPVSPGSEITVVRDNMGRLNLFTIGTGGAVFAFQPDPSSDTGWTQSPTPMQASQIAGGLTPEGNLIVFTPSGKSVAFTEKDPVSGVFGAVQVAPNGLPFPVAHVKAKRVGAELLVSVFFSVTDDPTAPPFHVITVPWKGVATNFGGGFDPAGFVLDSFQVEPVAGAAGTMALAVLTPQIYTKTTTISSGDVPLWSDLNNGSGVGVTVWGSSVAKPFTPIGDFAQSGRTTTPPGDLILCLASVEDPDPAIPKLLKTGTPSIVWNDTNLSDQSVSACIGSADGYTSLGGSLAISRGTDEGSAITLVVRNDMVAPGAAYTGPTGSIAGDQPTEARNPSNIWSDQDGDWNLVGGSTAVSFDRITARDAGGIAGNAFLPIAGFDGPFSGAACLSAAPKLQSVLYFSPVPSSETGVVSPQKLPLANPAQILSFAVADTVAAGNPQIVAVLDGGFVNAYDPNQHAWVPVDSGVGVQKVSAGIGQGGMELFAIGKDQFLYHSQQDPTGTWRPLIQILSGTKFQFVKAAADGQGELFGFAVTTGNLLFRLIKNEDLEWEVEEIQYENASKLIKVASYTTEITIRDEQGALRPGAKVDIWAEDVTQARINGKSYLLEPKNPVPVAANSAGLLTVIVEAQALHTPILNWRTEFMPAGRFHAAEPNWRIQQKLRTVTAPELAAGLKIDPEAVGGIADHINHAMSLISVESTSERGARAMDAAAGFPNRIDASVLKDQAWNLDFTRGTPVFRILSAIELEAIKRENSTLADLGIAEFFSDIGDLVNSAVEGICSVVSVTVAAVGDLVDAVEAEFVVLLNNLKYKLNVLVSKVEQVFDLVESALVKIGAKFQQAYEWLAFAFNWGHIVLTHRAVAAAINESIRFTGLASQAISTRLQAGITAVQAQMNQNATDFVNELLGGSTGTLQSFQRKNVPADDGLKENTGSNVVLAAFLDNATKAPALFSKDFLAPREDGDPLNALFKAIEDLGNDVDAQAKASLDKAVALFSQIGQNPDQALQLGLAGFIELGVAIANVGFSLAGQVVKALFDAIAGAIQLLQDVLNTPWSDFPLITQLYEQVIAPGSKLTAIDLFALIVSVPGTVLYKSIFNVAPFLDENSVTTFTNAFTAEWILEKTGLTPSRNLADPPLAVRTIVAQVAGVHYAAAYGVFAVLDAVMDVTPSAAIPNAFTLAGLMCEWMIFMFSCPWAIDATNDVFVKCTDKITDLTPTEKAEFSNMIWLCSAWIQPLVDSVVFCRTKNLTRNSGTPGLLADIVISWGLLATVITQNAKGCYTTTSQAFQAYLSVLPGAMEFLKLPLIVTPTSGGSLLVQAFIDMFGYVGTAVLQVSMMTGSAPLEAQEAGE